MVSKNSFFLLGLALAWQTIAKPLKVLHLSFHAGCIQDFAYVAQKLNLELTSILPQHNLTWFDPSAKGNAIYNIGHNRAERIWKHHKNYFEQFDVVITSDTAPLSRIFLQNRWNKPLIIWVCNRFDYHDAASLDCQFPDPEYYELMQEAIHNPHVHIISYTPFEQHYAKHKGINFPLTIIKPCAQPSNKVTTSHIPTYILREATFFVPPYHNDTLLFTTLKKVCDQANINIYQGRYNGPGDIKDFKGIIHFPYSWSNLALFENMHNGLPYFIPSKRFLYELMSIYPYFFPNKIFATSALNLSEWYNPEHHDIFVYFDSWYDLAHKIQTTDYAALRMRIKNFAHVHHTIMLEHWRSIFNSLPI